MFSQTVVVSAEAEYEVASLSDVDAVSDVLEQEGETFSSGQCSHVTLRQSQVSADRRRQSDITKTKPFSFSLKEFWDEI